MKRDALLKLYRQGVVTEIWVKPYKGKNHCIEYRLNNGDRGKLEGYDKKTGIRKFRSIDAACKVVNGLGVEPVQVFMHGNETVKLNGVEVR